MGGNVRKIGFVILILTLVFAVGCGGSSSSTPPPTPTTKAPVAECIQFLDNSFFFGTVRLADVKIGGTTLGGSAVNVAPLAVNAGPVSTNPQTNVAYTTVQVCTPGSTTSCVTIPNVAVDTGSSGLRIPASLVSSLNLPNVYLNSITPASGGSSNGSELASSVPIHVMGDTSIPTGNSIPTTCSQVPTSTGSTTTGQEEDDVAHLGANGLLGVGNYIYDCDVVGNAQAGVNACSSASTPPPGTYYTCSSSSCTPALVPAAQQVRNPVSLFTDNNGVILKLQNVAVGGLPTATGTMVFGIGTQSNNGLGSAVVLTLDSNFNDPAWSGFTTVFPVGGVSYPNSTENNLLLANNSYSIGSFLDSGSNGIFFLDQPTSGITDCSGSSLNFYYCPATSPDSLQATNQATGGNSSLVQFSVSAANTLSFATNTAFSDLAGPNTPQNPGNPSFLQKAADGYFDWGLPFFYGRNVYTAIQGVTPPSGVQAGPWWAY
jgi:hypothetical protein